ALDTIDEVRPIKAIVDWVKDWKTNKMKNGARVDATINEILKAFFNDPFITWWMSRQGLWFLFYVAAKWVRPFVAIHAGIWCYRRLIGGPSSFEHYRKVRVKRLN